MDLSRIGNTVMVREIWLVTRELGGWAEAGGIKDVVHDQSRAFPQIGWKTHVVLPLYGFLRGRVQKEGRLMWFGPSLHPTRPVNLETWVVEEGNHTLHFVRSPAFDDKESLYTYTVSDEVKNPRNLRGAGFFDGFEMNLEFQWAVATYWDKTQNIPCQVLGHDGHTGFLPAICRTRVKFESRYSRTIFSLLIHNAGPGYRQEMEDSPFHRDLLGLAASEAQLSLLDHHLDPMVSASRHAKLATVSENYANELKTGKNDRWSGSFGKWLRSTKVPLKGITNGIDTDDKDPRDPDSAGLPAGFDPLRGDWEGKGVCRRILRDRLLLKPATVHGRLGPWKDALYVMQGRLTAQKGVDSLFDLISKALVERPKASFLVMAQGERHYEERLIHLARNSVATGRFLFINTFEESLARLVFAAGDFFLMPSEYEPCGLTDLKAQLMGTLPIVHRVGGLVKVLDEKTGFSYIKNQGSGFWGAFLRSLHVWENDPDKLFALRRQAFVAVLEEFQWPRILEEHYVPWLTEQVRFPILTMRMPT